MSPTSPEPERERETGVGRIRVAVVGLGWAGRSIWLPRLREHPGYEVAALVDPDPAIRAELDSTGPVAVFAHPDQLSRHDVDLAVVAVPNHLHCPIAAGLLQAGIPVFVEKPVCLSTAEADRLAAAERAGGAVLLAGSAACLRADLRALYALAGQLGTLRHVDVSWVRAHGVPDAGGWFTRRDLAGGGALVDLGWHLLDAVVPLAGPGGFVEAVGTISGDFVADAAWGAVWRQPAGAATRSGGDVEDTARAFLVSAGGVSVSLRASWASHEPLDATVIRVEGSAGSAELHCTFGFSPNRRPASSLSWTRAGTTTPVDVATEPVGTEYRRQLDELPGLLRDPDRHGLALAQARSTIAAIERIYDSARSRQPANAHPAQFAVAP
ncbi:MULTISPECIES: Gfo/Idh/MocA family oxidoreductase [unclassified Frankia]|uniref:Gfo/Idh/MocA family protein n=1 Tax=Frankia sp. CcI49 TaxID=1745382 RepID=UPI000B240235|nr:MULTISPECIES: Gfo/Idh/MocA family oxidoreductase [unclassified Frankia]